jgi:hypothetical protein
METLWTSIAEKTVVGGAFLYMLYFFLNRFVGTQDRIVDTLVQITGTLTSMNTRLDRLEAEISELKEGVKKNE